MFHKLKVDLNSLLIAFDKYEDGMSFANIVDELNLDIHTGILRDKYYQNYSSISEVYIMKAKKTTYEEKLNIVKFYLDNELSYKEIARKFNVTYGQVYQWVQKYKKHGSDGLIDRRGKGKSQSILTSEEVN